MNDSSSPRTSWYWWVSTTPGEKPSRVHLESCEPALPTGIGSFRDDVGEMPCYRIASHGWPPGWYELRGRTVASRVQDAPHLYAECPHEAVPSVRLDLPYPQSNGHIRMLLQLLRPADGLFYCPGVNHASAQTQEFSLCRVSRGRALWRMLMGAELQQGLWSRLCHGARFFLQALRGDISSATTALYARYGTRVLNESANAHIRRVAEAMAQDDRPKETRTGDGVDETLAPFVIEETQTGQDTAQRLAREYRLLASSGLFDADYYLDHHPDVREVGLDPLLHFCQSGWKLLYNPSAQFDVWWYWSSHLDPARETINPLAHHALVGRKRGLETQSAVHPANAPGQALSEDVPARRACLFAGYDPDGIVDACVIDYLRELSRHADVWYMADSDMRPGELDKLEGLVRGAWSEPHGAYDFGSWSTLARDRVGWDTLEAYDEVWLVNDSCYLLRGLDEVLARMDAKPCNWWGMQATKGLYATRDRASNRFREPISMDRVRQHELARFAGEDPYDFHIGSYFLALRSPVIADPGFQRRLGAVVPQEHKANIIGKYEIGIGRYLMAAGHPFETFIERLYPFHPVYSETAFTLLSEGFPFLKRYLLAENHYQVPDLADWKARVLQVVPDAPVDCMERNLLRTSNYEKLYHSMHITRDRAGRVQVPQLLDDKAFARADAIIAVHDNWWAFPVCAFTHRFTGNERALFEAVKDDPSIRKIVLTQTRHVEVDGQNVVVVPLRSHEGQQCLLRARQIFIKHSPTRNIVYPVSPNKHNIINLWHGVPLKRIGYASLDMRDKLDRLAEEHRKCRAVIAASRVDAMAMASAFYPLSYHDVWVTGLPRHDFILRNEDALPGDLREQSARLAHLLDRRKLVLFVPTFKQAQEQGGYYHFDRDELKALEQWLHAHHAVLGVREHMADRGRTYGRALGAIGALDLGHERFPDIEMLYRQAAALVTDYSSSFIDFMLTGKPMVSFAYDYDNYAGRERGLFYDMDLVFPGPVCKNFAQLMEALKHIFDDRGDKALSAYAWKCRLFFDYRDDANAQRLLYKLKKLHS